MKATTLILISILIASLAFGGEKYRAPTSVKPVGLPGEIYPENQIQGHTCGWHAIRSIYRSYGLKIEDYDLRLRLGVDKKSVPFLTSTKGTIHPDVLRVLDQDGFSYSSINIRQTSGLQKFHQHFESGHYALGLINRKQNNALHWIVLSGTDNYKYTVVDSLYPQEYKEDLKFLSENVQTVLLISPLDSGKEAGKGKSHRKGLFQGLKSLF